MEKLSVAMNIGRFVCGGDRRLQCCQLLLKIPARSANKIWHLLTWAQKTFTVNIIVNFNMP
jgi:hypothetical protein